MIAFALFGIQSNAYGVNSITSPRSHGYTRRLAALGNVSTTLSKKVGFRWLPLCTSSLPCLWTWWSQRGQTSMPSRPSHGTASQAIFSFNIKLWLASFAARWSWAYWQGLCCDLISSCDPKVKDFYIFLQRRLRSLCSADRLVSSGYPFSVNSFNPDADARCWWKKSPPHTASGLRSEVRPTSLPVFRLVQAGTTGCPFVILNRHVSRMSGTVRVLQSVCLKRCRTAGCVWCLSLANLIHSW